MDTACCRCLHWPCTGVAKEEQGAFFVCLSACLPLISFVTGWEISVLLAHVCCLCQFNLRRLCFLILFVCVSVCPTARLQPISVNLPVSGKNWVTDFGGDLVPDMDSGSLFHFPHHCGMVDLMRFISISHTVTFWFLWQCAKWVTPARN